MIRSLVNNSGNIYSRKKMKINIIMCVNIKRILTNGKKGDINKEKKTRILKYYGKDSVDGVVGMNVINEFIICK